MKYFLIFFIILISSCHKDTIPKPKAYLGMEFPKTEYTIDSMENCPFLFERNRISKIVPRKNCWFNIEYPQIKATIYLSYMPVTKNLDSLIRDIEKLAFSHAIKAQGIPEKIFENPEKRTYGLYFSMIGNTASQAQFYVTDSLHHFLSGSLYFYATPNYDSIYPVAEYVQKDMRHLMESLSWKQ